MIQSVARHVVPSWGESVLETSSPFGGRQIFDELPEGHGVHGRR
jgi:hypothetical protein